MGSAYYLQKIWQCNVSELLGNTFSIIHFGFERIQGSPAHNFLQTVRSFKYKNLPTGTSLYKPRNLSILRSPISEKDHEVSVDLALETNCEMIIIVFFKINCLGGLEHLMSQMHHMHVSER